MGQIINYFCNSCDFEFQREDSEFYFDKDLNNLNEDMLLFLTCEKIAESPISGRVYLAYCNNCNEYIKTYELIKNETKLSNVEIMDLIIEKSGGDELKVIITGGDNEMFIDCPNCGEKVKREMGDGDSCPNCENGKLLASFISNVD